MVQVQLASERQETVIDGLETLLGRLGRVRLEPLRKDFEVKQKEQTDAIACLQKEFEVKRTEQTEAIARLQREFEVKRTEQTDAITRLDGDIAARQAQLQILQDAIRYISDVGIKF
jgi:hypothetical protein